MHTAQPTYVDRSSPTTMPRTSIVTSISAAAILVGIVNIAVVAQNADSRIDFTHYYVSAQYLNEGLNPYRTSLTPRFHELGFAEDIRIPYGANPPLLIRLMSPLALLPPSAAFTGWFLLQAVSLVGLLWTIRRILGPQVSRAQYVAMMAVFVNGTAIASHFSYSQVQLLVAWGIATALLLHLSGRTKSAVALITLAASFKIYPAVLIPWFMFSKLRGRQDFFERLAVSSVVLFAALAIVGIDGWRSFIQDGLPTIQMSVVGSWTNYSIPSFASASTSLLTEGTGPPVWSAAVGKLLAVLTITAVYLRISRGDLKPQVAVSLLTLATMASSLVCWSHYFVLAALPAAVLVAESFRDKRQSMLWPSLIAALLIAPALDAYLPNIEPIGLRVVVHFYPLYIMALAAVMLSKVGLRSAEIKTNPAE